VIFEVAHQIGVIPVLGMLIFGRKLPRVYWLVALAFFVSWFADSAMHFIGGTWEAWYFFLPVQVWLMVVAFTDNAVHWLMGAVALLLLLVASWTWHAPAPDQLVTVIGSVAILYMAGGRLAWPLYVYFGAGTAAYLVMVSQVGSNFMPWWYCYQGCRALSYILFIGIIAPPVIHRHRGKQCG
jgi:hypothetical protein